MQTNETVGTAREEAGAVAGTVKEETKHVAQAATEQARTTMHRVQNDVRTAADQQSRNVAQTLHSTADELRNMADAAPRGDGLIPSLAREGGSAVDRLASRMESGGLDALMADVRGWARRNPGTFLLGTAALGFFVGRLARNTSASTFTGGNGQSAAMQDAPTLSTEEMDLRGYLAEEIQP
jgi:hypothetical protein